MSGKQPLNILINGWYGQLNAGDDAILDVFVERTASRFDARFTVLSELPGNIPPTSRLRSLFHPSLLGRRALRHYLNGDVLRHLRAIRQADLVVLGGGGILRDNTNWRNLLRLLDEIWLAKLFGRKTMMYAIGVGPFRSRIGKWLIGATARACDLVTVRSQRAAELLREVGVPAERIHVVADPAFLLPARPPAAGVRAELEALFGGGKRRIGFYPTFFLRRRPENLARIAAAFDQLAETEDVEFVALPMSVLDGGMDDVVITRRIRDAMRSPEALHVYERRLTAQELKWASALAPLNITVRLHAMIFSLGCGVPVVPLNYEPKVPNVFEDFAAPEYLVDFDEDLEPRLVDSVRLALRRLDTYAAHVEQRLPRVAARSDATFELMARLFDGVQTEAAFDDTEAEAQQR